MRTLRLSDAEHALLVEMTDNVVIWIDAQGSDSIALEDAKAMVDKILTCDDDNPNKEHVCAVCGCLKSNYWHDKFNPLTVREEFEGTTVYHAFEDDGVR